MKTKLNIKSLVIGTIIGGMLTTGVGYASSQLTSIEVNLVPVTFKHNGQQVEQDKEIFIYKGTTYAPVRWISETLGKNVSWDGNERTISITDQSAVADKEDKGTEQVTKDIKLTLDKTEYAATDTIKLTIKNEGTSSISFGTPYRIEYLKDGKWTNWPMDDIFFTMELIILDEQKSYEQSISVSQLGLVKGEYRVIKNISIEGKDQNVEVHSSFKVK